MATLSHGGEVKTFYGAGALIEAHEAAANGDVITLSAGTFTGTDITKGITLRGSGMDTDSVTHREPTFISTDFKIDVNDSISERLTIEGIRHNGKISLKKAINALFLKCRFNEIGSYDPNLGADVLRDLNFIHCRIADRFCFNEHSSASLTNCVVKALNKNNSGQDQYFSLTNCVILDGDMLNCSEYKNCIIVTLLDPQSSSIYYNNLYICQTISDLRDIKNTTNVLLLPNDERITNLIGDYSDDKTYTLSEAVKSLIKGTDGKEVGIYGGNLPYLATPSNPQITKFNVSPQSDAEGKLSVDIEVSVAR